MYSYELLFESPLVFRFNASRLLEDASILKMGAQKCLHGVNTKRFEC